LRSKEVHGEETRLVEACAKAQLLGTLQLEFIRELSGANRRSFPRCHWSRLPAKQRVARWRNHIAPLREHRWAARGQLVPQMGPLMAELTGANWDGLNGSNRPNLGPVEGIAAFSGLVMN